MSTFKVGDKVRRINIPFINRMCVGYEGTVTKVSSNGLYISVDKHIVGLEAAPYAAKYFELIPEEPEMTAPVLKNMKIRIKDAIHSRMVQEALFEMGCKWQGYRDQSVRNVQSRYLYVDDYYVSYGNTDSIFDKYPNEEVELVTTCSFKPVDQEAKRKAAEKGALQQTIIELQKQLDEMKQKLESM